MVGPSSSHTAGAVRLGNLARLIAGEPFTQARCHLYNSFAKTYRGHGTDRGLIAGLLGLTVDDARIRDAYDLLADAPCQISFIPEDRPNHYPPNTVVFYLTLGNGEALTIVGHSVGGGKVYISRINEDNVTLKGDTPTLLLFYKDQPGMISRVTQVLADEGINIATLVCSRQMRGVKAFMTITLDTQVSDAGLACMQAIDGMHHLKRIDPLPA